MATAMLTDDDESRLRVLHVAGGIEPELGGPSVAILNYLACGSHGMMASHLVTAIDDPSSAFASNLRSRIESSGATVTFVRRTGRFTGRASRWGVSVPLIAWLRNNVARFDVIVAHGAWMFSSLSASVIAGRNNLPTVLVPHESLTDFDMRKAGPRFRPLAKRALKRYYARSTRLFLFTSAVEANASFAAGAVKRAILPYPLVDSGQSTTPPRTPRGLGLRLGFLGRIDVKKNVGLLLDAIARLPAAFSLVIGGAGDPELVDQLKAHARQLDIENRVVWKGFVEASIKRQFFNEVDVLVMPSQFESFGIVAAEAMIHGVPAIVAPRTGAAELIKLKGGGMVTDANVEAIVRDLLRLSENRDVMTRLSREAPLAVQSELSFAAIGARLGAELRQVVR